MSGYKEKESKGKSGRVVFFAALGILAVAVIIIAAYFISSYKTRKLNEELAAEHTTRVITQMTTAPVTETEATTAEPPPLVTLASMESFVSANPDTAGWIKIDGTSIDNVIVQTEDNEYYLDRDFYGKKSQAGTVFADFRAVMNDYNENQSDNIVLYGHNQADGTMFGTLNKYKIKHSNTSNFDFYLEHPTFTFSNLYEEYTYKIIATFITEVEPKHNRNGIIFDYHNYVSFNSGKRTYDSFIENVMSRSAIDTGVDVCEDDKFVTLSTCSNEFEPSRLVVIGRRVRDGESTEVDTSKAVLNEDAIEPDYNFIYNQ